MNPTPVVIFVYKRPLHARQLLESLSRNAEASATKLIVFADAARCASEEEAVEATRDVVRASKWCGSVDLVVRQSHLGLRKNIMSAVSEILSTCDRAIFLEEDLVVCDQFLSSMTRALDKYQDEERVMHVSAYMWPLGQTVPESFFLNFTGVWGWGTWSRAWRHLHPDANELAKRIEESGRAREFCLNGGYPPLLSWLRRVEQEDIWAVQWYASVFLAGGLSLQSGASLTCSTGTDGTGLHSPPEGIYDVSLSPRGGFHAFPERLAVDVEMSQRLSAWFKSNRSLPRRISTRTLKILRQIGLGT